MEKLHLEDVPRMVAILTRKVELLEELLVESRAVAPAPPVAQSDFLLNNDVGTYTWDNLKEIFQVSKVTLAQWEKEGILPEGLRIKGRVRFLKSEVDAMLLNHSTAKKVHDHGI